MKKILRLFALMALLAVPIGASATTDTITVANGTEMNNYLPIYGLWADADQHNQIIYPASMLNSMIGQNIIAMKFYITGGFSCTGTISMAIVSDSVLSGLNTTATLVQVWSGTLSPSGDGITLDFTNAMTYTGGNLLVDIQTISGSYSSSTAYGISRSNASYYSYNGNSYTQNFLPKADFVFSDGAFCNAPVALTFDTNSTNSLTFHWSHGASETTWDVMVGDSLIAGVADTFITVTDLNASSRYNVRVRSVCGVDELSAWTGAVMMQTECASITNLPWSCDFEGEADGNTPLCWTISRALRFTDYSSNVSEYPTVYNSTYYSHSGGNSLYFNFYGYYTVLSDTAVIASPYFAHNPSDLHVNFWAYFDYVPDDVVLQAGIMTDPADSTTFIPLLTVTGEFPESYTQYEFYTSSLTDFSDGDSACVAFRVISGDATSYSLVIDDVTVDAMGSCIAPVLNSGVVDSVSYESVQLTWQMPNDDTYEFDVMLVNMLTNDTTHHEATDTTVLIENINSFTLYEAYVATVCGTDTTNYIPLANFITHRRCYSVENATVAALTANAASLTWTFSGYGIEPASVELLLTDLTDSNVTPVNVSVSGSTGYTFTGLAEGHMYQVDFLTLCGSDDSSLVVNVTFMPHNPPCAEFAGTASNSYVPFYSFYNNGFSEMLYSGADLAGTDSIMGITFEVATPLSRDNVIDIYMAYSNTLTNLTTSNYMPVSQMTRVVTNYHLNTGAAGWTDMIPFDTIFAVPDSGNLVLAVYNHTGSYSSGLYWATHPATVGSSVYCYTDNDILVSNPFSGGSTGTVSDAPNVQFYGICSGGDCLPASPAVSSTDTSSITLTWLPGDNESSWIVQYREAGASTWTTAGTATAQPYIIAGLNAGTNYQIRLGSDCLDTVVYSQAIAASTVCGLMHAPFSIVPTGENLCWTYNGNGYYSSYDNDYYIYSGGSIVTPAIAESINTLQLKVTGYGYDFYVGACSANGANPEWIDTVSFTDAANYGTPEMRKVYLNNYAGSKDHIILKATNGYNYTYFYNIAVEPLDDCMPIDSLTVDSVTTSAAWLSWVSDGNSFEVRYHAESDTTDTWTTATTTTTSINLTGLNSNDRYWVKVFNVCSATERSDSLMLRFDMGCSNFSTPFVENFGLEDLPVCWSAVNGGNVDYGWEYTASYGYDYLISEADNGTAKANDWLMTPVIQMPANADNYQLIYYIGGGPDTYSSNSSASCEIRISTTGSGDTAAYTTLLRIDTVDTYNSSTYSYSLHDSHVSLSAYSGQAVSFAFVNRSRDYGEILLADVEVRQTVTPLYYISGNDVVFLGDTGYYYASYQEGVLDSMNLQWTSTMAAAGHAVMLNGTNDSMQMIYTAEGIDTLTFIASNPYGADTSVMNVYVYNCAPVTTFPFHESFESATAPAGCWTLVYGDGNPSVNPMLHGDVTMDNYLDSVPDGQQVFRFSSYSSSTDYNQYLISRELNGSNMLLSFKYRKGSYSDASVDNIRVGYSSTTRDTNSFTWGNWITDISVSNWATFTDTIPEGTKFVAIQYWGDYAYYIYIDDFTITGQSGCMAPTIDSIIAGETSLTINYTSDADSVEVIVASGIFNPDAAGVIATGGSYTATGLTHSTLYTIAVRALCSDEDVSEWAVVTDSTLVVNCGVPTGLAVEGTGYTSVTLGWTAAGEEHGWEVVVFNTLDTVYATSNTTSVTVDGLNAHTTYSARVRALCGQNADIEGEWSEPIQVTTNACSPVTDVVVSNVTGNTANVSWTAPEGATAFRIIYGTHDFDQGGEIATFTTQEAEYHITSLEHNTDYTVRVANLCTETLLSQYASADFTTGTEGIATVDAEGNLSIYPNPASAMVTISVSEQLAGATATVVDLNGRTVASFDLANNTATFDVSSLAKGAYFVRITGEQATTVRKLIVK